MPERHQTASPLIRVCRASDFDDIYSIVNEAAQAYRGVIPADCWHEPYMHRGELKGEIDSEVVFYGYERDGRLLGVMGMQQVDDATLIRHAYVRTGAQRAGIGVALLAKIVRAARLPLMVGTWAAASWAIAFYQKHGFETVSREQTDSLLGRYWRISRRQTETSLVLVWNEAHNIYALETEVGGT